MKKVSALLVAGALSVVASAAFAHGVGVNVSPLAPFGFEFFYSTGESMDQSPTKVYAPGQPDTPWVEGKTDNEGHYAFIPNKDGEWKVTCDGGEGHLAVATVNINLKELNSTGGAAKNVEVKGSHFPKGKELFIHCLLGVSLLFNISALFVFLRRRKQA